MMILGDFNLGPEEEGKKRKLVVSTETLINSCYTSACKESRVL